MRAEFESFRTRLREATGRHQHRILRSEEGRVLSVGDGVAQIGGLAQTALDALLDIEGVPALAMDLMENTIGAALLNEGTVRAGSRVRDTGRVFSVPVGDKLLGRVVDPLGRPLDAHGELLTSELWPAERPVPTLAARAAVTEPLVTGIAAIDALFPIGRGQRQLIIGDRGTGKTTIATDAIINQRRSGVRCVYVSIGQMTNSTAAVIGALVRSGAMRNTVVVIASPDAPAGVRFLAPYAGCTIAEWFADRGEDAIVVFDDLTSHAVAYRELSLLLRRPPGREAYPGDVFFIHARLLERSTRFTGALGGGSLTAIPVVQTRAGRIADFITTNVISITDGQIVLDRSLFERGVKPAISVGASVSRIGARTQGASMREVAGRLRLDIARFLELEAFSRFGARLEEETKRVLSRGARARELLKQAPGHPLTIGEQVVRLLALDCGLFDDLAEQSVSDASQRLLDRVAARRPDVLDAFERGRPVTEADRSALRELF